MKKKQVTKKFRADIRQLEAFKNGDMVLSATNKNKLHSKLLKALQKILWETCKQIVREIDGDYCISCGGYIESNGGKHTGHFIAGAVSPTWLYYELTNLHVQCAKCNYNSGNIPDYERAMIFLYGQDHVYYLKSQSGRTLIIGQQKPDLDWYEEKIKRYKEILADVSVRKMQGWDKYHLRQYVLSLFEKI